MVPHRTSPLNAYLAESIVAQRRADAAAHRQVVELIETHPEHLSGRPARPWRRAFGLARRFA